MYSIEKQTYTLILFAVGMLSILIATGLIVIIRYHSRKIKLYRQQVQADTELLEEERTRVAADLHDDLGASLSAIKVMLQCIEFENYQELKIIENAESYIDDAMQKLRQIAYNLMPYTLKVKGIKEALLELVAKLNIKEELQINFSCEVEIKDYQKRIHVFRIIQETLHNSLKHSNASQINIRLNRQRNYLVVNIEDNGKGFEKNNVFKNTGRGLQNVIARTNVLRANMNLSTSIGKGVIYIFKIPLENELSTH